MSPRLPRRLEPFTSWLAVAAAAATAASTASALGVGSWQQRGVVMAAMAQWMPSWSQETVVVECCGHPVRVRRGLECWKMIFGCYSVWLVTKFVLEFKSNLRLWSIPSWYEARHLSSSFIHHISVSHDLPGSFLGQASVARGTQLLSPPDLEGGNRLKNGGVSESNFILVPCWSSWSMQLYHYDRGPALLAIDMHGPPTSDKLPSNRCIFCKSWGICNPWSPRRRCWPGIDESVSIVFDQVCKDIDQYLWNPLSHTMSSLAPISVYITQLLQSWHGMAWFFWGDANLVQDRNAQDMHCGGCPPSVDGPITLKTLVTRLGVETCHFWWQFQCKQRPGPFPPRTPSHLSVTRTRCPYQQGKPEAGRSSDGGYIVTKSFDQKMPTKHENFHEFSNSSRLEIYIVFLVPRYSSLMPLTNRRQRCWIQELHPQDFGQRKILQIRMADGESAEKLQHLGWQSQAKQGICSILTCLL